MEEIENNLSRFNASGTEAYTLSVAMGYTGWQKQDNAEHFLMRMDEKMYEEKRRYHQQQEKLHPGTEISEGKLV